MAESDKFKRVPVLIPWDIYRDFEKLVQKKTGRDRISPYIVEMIVQAIEEEKKKQK